MFCKSMRYNILHYTFYFLFTKLIPNNKQGYTTPRWCKSHALSSYWYHPVTRLENKPAKGVNNLYPTTCTTCHIHVLPHTFTTPILQQRLPITTTKSTSSTTIRHVIYPNHHLTPKLTNWILHTPSQQTYQHIPKLLILLLLCLFLYSIIASFLYVYLFHPT